MLKLPKISILSGITVDGKLNLRENFSSKYFDKFLPKAVFEPQNFYRKNSDAIMVGSQTVKIDNPKLISNENPFLKRIIISRKLNIPINYKIFKIKPENTIIITTLSSFLKKDKYCKKLKKRGVNFLVYKSNRLNFKKILIDLKKKFKINKILVEGGGKLNYILLKEKLVSEVQVVLFPFIVGNKKSTSFVEGGGFLKNFKHGICKLKLKKIKKIAYNFLYIKYEVQYN